MQSAVSTDESSLQVFTGVDKCGVGAPGAGWFTTKSLWIHTKAEICMCKLSARLINPCVCIVLSNSSQVGVKCCATPQVWCLFAQLSNNGCRQIPVWPYLDINQTCFVLNLALATSSDSSTAIISVITHWYVVSLNSLFTAHVYLIVLYNLMHVIPTLRHNLGEHNVC